MSTPDNDLSEEQLRLAAIAMSRGSSSDVVPLIPDETHPVMDEETRFKMLIAHAIGEGDPEDQLYLGGESA